MHDTQEQSSFSNRWSREKTALFVLRASLAFTFLYAGISGFLNPMLWVGYMPDVARRIADPVMLLSVFGAGEVLLALWLLWGRALTWTAGIATLLLVGITLTNLGQFVVVFRDLALAGASAALYLVARK